MIKKKYSGRYPLRLGLLLGLLALLALSAASGERVWIYAGGRPVVVDAPVWRDTAGIIRGAGVKLAKDDGYIRWPGNIIEVVKAVQVNFWRDGRRTEFWTGQPTVARALARAGIDTKGRTIFPAADTRPLPGMDIVLLGPDEQIMRQNREIPYTTVTRPDSRRELGEQTVIAPGAAGSKSVLLTLAKQAGGAVWTQVLSEKILAEPQDKIVALGTANVVATSRGELRFKKMLRMQATAYTPWDAGCIGITANGMTARRGLVAVDPSVIALGARLFVPGYGPALAADTGGAIRGHRIDLCMESTDEALAFGRRDVKVYILE